MWEIEGVVSEVEGRVEELEEEEEEEVLTEVRQGVAAAPSASCRGEVDDVRLFAPHQLGVGVRGGCEAIIHTVRKTLASDPSLLLCQADYLNAFNLASREKGLDEVARVFPEILAWVSTCYGQPSILLYGALTILSERGWHQGDPLSGLLFCLVLLPLITTIKERVPTMALQAWFLDDGTFLGRKEDLVQVIDILVAEGPARGLVLSTTLTSPASPKTTVWCPAGPLEPPPAALAARGLVFVGEEGVTLLGAPLGSREFVEEEVEKVMSKVAVMTERLQQLEDLHTEFVLQQSCYSLPKFSFILRTVDTTGMMPLLRRFDTVTRDGLARILGTTLDDRAWHQAKLPVSKGGMGMKAAEDHALWLPLPASSPPSRSPTPSRVSIRRRRWRRGRRGKPTRPRPSPTTCWQPCRPPWARRWWRQTW